MRRTPWLVIVLTPLLMATSCPAFIRVQVQPGATVDAPELRFSLDRQPLRGLDSLMVFPCPDKTLYGFVYDSALSRLPVLWRVVRDPAPAPGTEPLRITYGRVPAGYREESAARRMEPGGCYLVRVVALPGTVKPMRAYNIPVAGGQRFRLLPDGRMIAGGPTAPLLDTRPLREINRASVACARGYRRARTRADSAAVDARQHPILDTPLSCGWLHDHWPDVMSRPLPTEHSLLAAFGLLVGLTGAILSSEP